MSRDQTRVVLFIHSIPKALCSHVEWALAEQVAHPVSFEWLTQPVSPGTFRSEMTFQTQVGMSAKIASILLAFPNIRFEVTEEASPGCDGQRIMYTPTLGTWRSAISIHGENLISEDRLRSSVLTALRNGESVVDAVEHVLGGPWDLELEPFRYAGEGVAVRWLHEVS